jgi:hypothetical protein
MAGLFTLLGERKFALAALANVGPLTVHLIAAPFWPANNLTPADFVEATFHGYAPIVLDFTGLEAGTPGGKAIGDYTPIGWTCIDAAVPNQIYGYFVTDDDGDCVMIEQFTGVARPMVGMGQNISLPISVRCWSPI